MDELKANAMLQELQGLYNAVLTRCVTLAGELATERQLNAALTEQVKKLEARRRKTNSKSEPSVE